MVMVNLEGVEEAQDFSPIPDGRYKARLTEIAIDRTKTGDEMWNLTWTVLEGEQEGKKIFDRIVFSHKALPRVKMICSRMGIPNEGTVELLPQQFDGKDLYVTTKQEKYFSEKHGEQIQSKVPFAGYESIEDGDAPF